MCNIDHVQHLLLILVMDVSKLLEILGYLDEEEPKKPISVEELYVKIFGNLPDDCSKVRENYMY